MSLECTDAFIKSHQRENSGYVIVGRRESLINYCSWEYGIKFTARFAREGAVKRGKKWILPIARGRGWGHFKKRSDAAQALVHLASVLGYQDGRMGKPNRDHGLSIERS